MKNTNSGTFLIKKQRYIAQFSYGKNHTSETQKEALVKALEYISRRKDKDSITLWWFENVGDTVVQINQAEEEKPKLLNALNCSEELFNSIYSELEKRVSSEAESLYKKALSACKTSRQRALCAGSYKGRWWKLFEKWLKGDVPNIYVLESISRDYIDESLL